MACVVWLVVKESDLSQRIFAIPVKVVNVPSNIATRLPRDTVQVTANVPESIASLLHPENFEIALNWESDLPAARTWCGATRFKESPPLKLDISRDIVAPHVSHDLRERYKRSISVLMVDPSSIRVEARYITRRAKIRFLTRNRPPEGFRVVEPIEAVVEPPEKSDGMEDAPEDYQEVLVTATENRFAELNAATPSSVVSLETRDAIDLADRTESFSEPVELILPEGVLLAPGYDQVRARIRIEESQTTRTLDGIAILVPPPSGNLTPSYDPRVASVVLYGPERLVKSVKPSDLIVRPTSEPDETRRDPQILDLMAAYSSSAVLNMTFMVEIRSVTPKTLMLQFREGAAAVTPTPTPAPVPLAPPVQTPTPERISVPPDPTPTPERISFPPEPTPTPERISVPPEPTPTPERISFPPEEGIPSPNPPRFP
jgi:hypothetical protein